MCGCRIVIIAFYVDLYRCKHQVYQPFIWIMLPQYRSHNMPIYCITKAKLSHKHDVKVTASQKEWTKREKKIITFNMNRLTNVEKYYCSVFFIWERKMIAKMEKKEWASKVRKKKHLPLLAKAIFIYQHHNRCNNKAVITRKMWG